MSEEPIERLLRRAADWEPEVEVRAGLARKALLERSRRTGRTLALAGSAFAFGFAVMAVLHNALPGAGTTQTPARIAATPSGGLEETNLPDGVQVVNAGQNKKTQSVKLRPPIPDPTPRPRRLIRPLRDGRLAPQIRTANYNRTFVPIDEPTVLPGVIAQPSADGTQVRLIPAAVSPDDGDVIVTRSENPEGIRP